MEASGSFFGIYTSRTPVLRDYIKNFCSSKEGFFFVLIYITVPQFLEFISSAYGEILKRSEYEHRDRDAWKTKLNHTCILSKSPLTLFLYGISL